MIRRSNSSLKNKSKLSSRKGVSLVEVVVALTIISIISVAAFSLIMSSMDLENNIMRDVEISAAADDVLDCFMFAKTKDQFSKIIVENFGYKENGATYLLEKGSYTIIVAYVTEDSGKIKMTFVALDSNKNFILHQVHTKG